MVTRKSAPARETGAAQAAGTPAAPVSMPEVAVPGVAVEDAPATGAPAGKAVAKKVVAKKAIAKKATAKKAVANKATVKKAVVKQASAKSVTADEAPPRTTATRAPTRRRAAPADRSAAEAAPPARVPVEDRTGVPVVNPSEEPEAVAAPREPPVLRDLPVLPVVELAELIESARAGTTGRAEAQRLPVRPGEDPWTATELAEVKAELVVEIDRLQEHLHASEGELVDLLRDGGAGAGRDPVDVGASNVERDHEMSLASNARRGLEQSGSALLHIRAGTYGRCDHCGEPIGKGRLQAFPRATLCVTCKQREERR